MSYSIGDRVWVPKHEDINADYYNESGLVIGLNGTKEILTVLWDNSIYPPNNLPMYPGRFVQSIHRNYVAPEKLTILEDPF